MDYSEIVLNVTYAIIPSILLCLYIYKKDVVEKEPIMMLVRLFFLGVLITVPTFFVEQTILSVTGITQKGYLNCFLTAFFVVALVEEGYKFIILYLGSWKNKNFDHKFDAIVYAVFVSLGFATLENILYVYKYGSSAAILRAIISVPAHAFYAVASGFFLGLAKKSSIVGAKKDELKYKILALTVPILLHGVFDFLLLTENEILLGIFYSFVAVLYLVSFISIQKVSDGEMLINKKKGIFKKKTITNEQVNAPLEPPRPVEVQDSGESIVSGERPVIRTAEQQRFVGETPAVPVENQNEPKYNQIPMENNINIEPQNSNNIISN